MSELLIPPCNHAKCSRCIVEYYLDYYEGDRDACDRYMMIRGMRGRDEEEHDEEDCYVWIRHDPCGETHAETHAEDRGETHAETHVEERAEDRGEERAEDRGD